MKKVYVFQTLIAVAVAITMTAAVAQHVPISDPVADCVVQTCDAGTLPPETCMAIPIPPDAGSDCFTTPGAACTGIWPTTPFAPMPTWDLLVYGDFDGTTFTLTGVDEATDPLEVILPATYDFCAWSDHLVCALTPFAGLADEIGAFAYLVQCANMDINGALDECRNIPVTNNGIPERYELAILEAVLNDPGHALNTVAIAAMQKNTDALCGLIVEALAAVEISSGPPPSYMDVRGLSYGSAPWLMPSLGGILAAEAAMDDPLSNIALGELLGLLEDLGLTLPAGGITSICDGVFETSQGGDISANGFTNREIYEWFIQVDLGMTPAQYAAYAMDPLAVPGAKIAISGGGSASLGDDVVLTVDVSNVDTGYSAVSYVWYTWGVVDTECQDDPLPVEGEPCVDSCDVFGWVVIAGETGSALSLPAAQIADSGKYGVDVQMDDGTKVVTGTILAMTTLVVTDSSGVPVGSALGLTLLAGACALAGAVGIRRRK